MSLTGNFPLNTATSLPEGGDAESPTRKHWVGRVAGGALWAGAWGAEQGNRPHLGVEQQEQGVVRRGVRSPLQHVGQEQELRRQARSAAASPGPAHALLAPRAPAITFLAWSLSSR